MSTKICNATAKYVLPVILILAGILFTVLGVRNVSARNTYKPAVATIVDITASTYDSDDTSYDVWVKFNVGDTDYKTKLGEYRASFNIGDTIDILYDESNPNKVMMKSYASVILTFGMAIISFAAFISTILKNKKKPEAPGIPNEG